MNKEPVDIWRDRLMKKAEMEDIIGNVFGAIILVALICFGLIVAFSVGQVDMLNTLSKTLVERNMGKYIADEKTGKTDFYLIKPDGSLEKLP